MTRRERLEARADRLDEWAAKRESRAAAVFEGNRPFTSDYAFNTQPGHIPLRARIIAQEDRQHESLRKAREMSSRADGVRAQLAGSIFSDDPDAVEQLTAKIARLEAERDRVKAYNASCRKGQRDVSLLDEKQQADLASIAKHCPYQLGKNGSGPSYWTTSLGAEIRRCKERIAQIETTAAMVEQGDRGYGRPMASRYAGTCPDCGGDFDRGAAIVYYRVTREAVCASCADAATSREP